MKRPVCVLWFATLSACGPYDSEPPNVLLISIDTLRADRLGCYGYERETSPALDRFARERAVRFELAVAESPWTLPSHVSLLTGLHPLTHGVDQPDLAPGDEVEFLAETLQREGYYCFGLTDGGWLSDTWGFGRGFHSFATGDNTFSDCVQEATEYIGHREDRGPWFGFLHTYDVHCPYDPPEPWFSKFRSPESEAIEVAGLCGNPHFNGMDLSPQQVAFLSDRYDGGVRWVDDALAKLFAYLDATNAWEDTIVIVLSDHGEEFYDHGQIGHERTLYRESLHVPLLIAGPGLEPRIVETPVGLTDVVPTLVDWLDLKKHDRFDGRSLLGLLRGHAESDPSVQRWSHLAWKSELLSRTSADEQVILDIGGGRLQRFDLKSDREEQRDLCASGDCQELMERLERELSERNRRGRSTYVIDKLRDE